MNFEDVYTPNDSTCELKMDPEEASAAEMVNYTIQALWSYRYMLFRFFIIPRVINTSCHHPDITELYKTTPSEERQGEQVFCKI